MINLLGILVTEYNVGNFFQEANYYDKTISLVSTEMHGFR